MLRGPGSLPSVAGPAALTVAVVLLATSGRYDLHGDELYFRMLPLAWWYEDQPPLTVWLSHLAARVSDAAWVQRLPAVAAAVAGTFVAALFPRVLGHPAAVQRVAAWAHAFTVYPLLIGHVFLTSSLDLVAWQVVTLLVLLATLGRPNALAWAGVVAGVACWNKLLVLVLVAVLCAGLLAARPALLVTRQARWAAAGLTLIGGPQVLAQLRPGWPMSEVSSGLIAEQGGVNRWLALPLLVLFVGPPLVGVAVRGLRWRPPGAAAPLLLVPGVLLVAWTLLFPAQPYYPAALMITALAVGWGEASRAGDPVWRRARVVVAANGAVATLICLPVLPYPSAAFEALARVNPVARDQAGWEGYVRQIADAADGRELTVVSDSYALAGAVSYHGPTVGLTRVASGHNALWDMGPPRTDEVLLVGDIARSHRGLFESCRELGALRELGSDPFGVAGSPLAWCRSPVGGWERTWPSFHRLGR